MKRKTQKTMKTLGIVLVILAMLIAMAFAFTYLKNPTSITYQGKNVKMLVPHFGSYRCEKIDVASPMYKLPVDGFWINNEIGYTDKIDNIQVKITTGAWSQFKTLFGGIRLYYKVCDAGGRGCAEFSDRVYDSGSIELSNVPSVIDPRQESIFIQLQARGFFLSDWKPMDPKDSEVRFSFDKYGLNLYSTTQGFGEEICSTGCDLSCPASSYREKLVSTPENTVDFDQSVSYLEFWDEPEFVGDQNGGTIWDPQKELFCFGGFIYDSGILEMESGETYLFPEKYLRSEECCPGALATLSQKTKLCNDNYEWVDIGGSQISCSSDLQCPGKGQDVCQKQNDKYFTKSYGCEENFCSEGDSVEVDCCSPSQGCAEDQVCQENKCVGGSVTPPAEDCFTNAECTKETGGQCVNNKCRYPDSSVCSSCDDFAKGKILGGLFKSQSCQAKVLAIPPQTTVFCWLSFVKLLLVPISLIFTFLFSVSWLERFKALKGKKKAIWRIVLSIILAGLIATFIYVSFWIGIILFIVYVILRVVLKIYFPFL